MSTDTAPPPADDKARYEAIKQELKNALLKKRDLDKHLVRTAHAFELLSHDVNSMCRPRSKSKSIPSKQTI